MSHSTEAFDNKLTPLQKGDDFCVDSQNVVPTRQATPCPQSGFDPNFNEKQNRRNSFCRKKNNERNAFICNERNCKSKLYSNVCKPVNSGNVFDSNVYNRRNGKCNCISVSEEDTEVIMKPQAGLASLLASKISIQFLAKFAGVTMPDKILREAEGLILLVATLSQQTNALGAMGVALTWAQGRITTSMFGLLREYIDELLGKPTAQIGGTPDWLECLRDSQTNWAMCKSNRAFKQVSKLLGILVTIGMCDQANLTFDIGQFNVFTPQLFDRHLNAFEIFDALFETIIFFVEGAYLCYQDKSIRPLLINDRSAMELDREYAQICAWFELVKNGNLSKFTKMSDQEFDKRMNRLAESLSALSQSLKGPEKKLVMDKFQKILIMQNDFITMKIASGVRHAPWAISLFGESAQGKTTMGDQLVDAVLMSQGFPLNTEYRCAFNASDKFMSNWTSDKLVMIFDDVANTKAEFAEQPPTRALVDVINNQMFYAPKAELGQKGKCFVEPWIVVATTNVKDLDARVYSKCPYSVQRRLITLTVRAKKEFQRIEDGVECGIDASKVQEHYTVDGKYTPPMFDDIWCITVEKAVNPGDLSRTAGYAPVRWRNQLLVDISMATCIQWAIEDFALHRKQQEALLATKRMRSGLLVLCHHEGCHQLRGHCPDHVWIPSMEMLNNNDLIPSDDDKSIDNSVVKRDDLSIEETRKLSAADEADWFKWFTNMKKNVLQTDMYVSPVDVINSAPIKEVQFGPETVKACTKLFYGSSLVTKQIDNLFNRVDEKAADAIYETGSQFLTTFHWIKLIPAPVLASEGSIDYIRWFYEESLSSDYAYEIRRRKHHWLFFNLFWDVGIGYHPKVWFVLGFISMIYYLWCIRNLYENIEAKFIQELKDKNMRLVPMLRKVRDEQSKHIIAAIVGLGALYGAVQAYRAAKESGFFDTQGSLEPESIEEVQQRDSEVNVWSSISKRELPISDVSKRMATDHVDNCVKKALVYGTLECEDKRYAMNAFFVHSNVLVVPDHYFQLYGDLLPCTFRKSNPEASGGKFIAKLHISASYLIPNSDLRLCYTPAGGSYKDLTEYFPTSEMPQVPFRLHWRRKDGDITSAKGLTSPGQTSTTGSNGTKSFMGGDYKNLSINTFGGMCGAALVSDTNGSAILGFHVGGVADTPLGCYSSLLKHHIIEGMAHLRTLEGVIISGSAGTFEPVVMGVSILKPDPLHPKSPLNYVPKNSQIEYLGSCIGRSVTKTTVKVTPISEHILDVCGVANGYCGPKLNPEWFGWQKCLSNMALPGEPYPHDLLEIAIMDYKAPIIEKLRCKKLKWYEATPLNDHDNLCGVAGKKFIDAIKLGTSVGFPLTGPKRDHVIELEPTEEWPCNRILEEALMEEIARIEAKYKLGERGYPIAKACKKDEILSSPKCRIFYGNALSLTFLIRKYYLPILRILQMNPLLSECAVGINSHGPEWEELHKHMTKFGMDRLFGGDYGKYDQKLPSQLIFAALRILIDFARECNYSEEDLRVMEAMTGDIVYAYIAFNGDLIGLTEGTHISGNSLTVIINGICGSLNLRCYFYTEYPLSYFHELMPNLDPKKFYPFFRDYIAISTYGDDNMGSVHPDIDSFTIKGCSEFLAKYGQEYTMPDKESELRDFLHEGELEFLKRTSVYHEALGRHLGALVDKSIYKSLHCFMRDKNCVDTEATACALNIDGALREWFNHGPEKYERQRQLMQEVAIRAHIDHICTGLKDSYEDRVANWFASYDPRPHVKPET